MELCSGLKKDIAKGASLLSEKEDCIKQLQEEGVQQDTQIEDLQAQLQSIQASSDALLRER